MANSLSPYHLLDDDANAYSGLRVYLHSDEDCWATVQKNLAEGEFEPWDIQESDYWVLISWLDMQDRTSKAVRAVFNQALRMNHGE